MNNELIERLTPCPFCGGEATYDHDDNGWNWIVCNKCGGSTNCRVSTMEDCRPLLAEQWNRRYLAERGKEAATTQCWTLNPETAKFLADMITAGDEPTEITFRVGFIEDDDGSVKHGLLVYESDYPEEGASLLAESQPLFLAPQIPEYPPITEDLVTRLRAMSAESIGDDAAKAIEGLIVEKAQAYELGKTDGWEACETCHGIVDGKLPARPVGDTDFEPKTCPEAYLQQEIAKLRAQPAIPEGMTLVGYTTPEVIINLRKGTWYGGARISPRVDEEDGLTAPIFAAAGVAP